MSHKFSLSFVMAAGLGLAVAGCALLPGSAAHDYHVATTGSDANPGTAALPLKTIQAAANLAKPGDTVTVHAGIYRERIDPPRGGTSESRRITYQAAPGEKVTITGSEPAKGWEKVAGDLWKLSIANQEFGSFNPFADLIRGDWCSNPHGHHTGCVYLGGQWLREADNLDQVKKPAGEPLWFAQVDGNDGAYIVNLRKLKPSGGADVEGGDPSFRYGGKAAPAAGEGGLCSGFVRLGNWLRFDNVDFGAASDSVSLRVSSSDHDSLIELRLDTPEGELLGTCKAEKTGGWDKWATLTAPIKPVSGKRTLAVVFKTPAYVAGTTTIYAQFPGVNPNEQAVEINRRQMVFYPSKNFINYITVRGFVLENAACNWAPPSSEQMAIVGTNWSKGWIIEDNEIRNAKCCGVALGKYGDGTDNTNDAGEADPYTKCVRRALANGWNKATIGSHVVRNNHIHHCEQTGIVGSMGCAFSTVEGNDIHDIDTRRLLSGAEQAGIKFHGFVDGIIRDNHIWRCHGCSGIWLDWMAQGAQVRGNLLHNNTSGLGDLFCEMQHGPLLVADNLFLSNNHSLWFNSKGIAIAHNLLAGDFGQWQADTRLTPFHPAHATEIAGLHDAVKGGDHRLYNNLGTGRWNANAFNACGEPCIAVGNVYAKGSTPSKFDQEALAKGDFDAAPKLIQKADGWYLSLREEASWKETAKRPLVTTALLGTSKVSGCAYENPDGTPLKLDADYFGKPRDPAHPFPGPFETPVNGEIKVWPK